MTPDSLTVKVGQVVEMLETVKAKMSDGTTKEVPVTWNPETIDTSTPGEKTAVGTVEGYNGTVTFTVFVEEIKAEDVRLFLYKDSTSSNNSIAWDTISNFYLKNIETGEEFRTGQSPWNRDDIFEMPNIPEGIYTIHFDYPDGMYIHQIVFNEKEVYDAETNPLVVKEQSKDWEKVYVNIVVKSETTLAEITPLDDLLVPAKITYNEFIEALPKQTTIIDSNGQEHQVDLKWDIRPFNFENWKKQGEVKIRSEFFNLPLNVSNTDPATSLEVSLNVIFSEATIESLVDPDPLTVNVGDTIDLPATVTANMSDGTKKEVPVTWDPKTIDTSTPGEKKALGSVDGYDGTVTFTVIVEELSKGNAYISLYKDSKSASNKLEFKNVTDFYLKNKKTGEMYSNGKILTGVRTNVYDMKDIPVGEYTIHFNMPDGMSIKQILLGESYKETNYDEDTNPLVIVDSNEVEKSYISIVLKVDGTLAEIKPLENLTVPADITLDEFNKALPKQVTIVDSSDKEHQVEIKWDIRPANFENYKKNGKTTLYSELFTLPINVSNTEPPTRLEVTLNVIFEEPINHELEAAIARADEAVKGLSEAIENAGNASNAQEEINMVLEKIQKVKELDEKYDTSSWDLVVAEQQIIVDQMKANEEAEQEAVNRVIQLINDLPPFDQISIEHKGIIEEARDAFDSLTDNQKVLVNTDRLVEAEKALAGLEEAIANEKDVEETKSALTVTVNGEKLTLQTKGSNDTTIKWQSSDSSYVNAKTGEVTRPWFFTKTVTLTATITKGKAKETQTFTVKVPALGKITVDKD